MDSMLDFSGKVALVTGAARGLGKLLAQALAERGAMLVLTDILAQELADTVNTFKAQDYKVASLVGDITQESHSQALVALAIEHFGKLDIAVNNAGKAPDMAPLHTTTEQTMDMQFAINVKGVQFGMKNQLIQMLAQNSGVILNVSSVAGIAGAPTISSYCAAKHAVIGLTKSAAVEYARNNIRINAVCPFFTLTNMVTDMSDSEGQKSLARNAPIKRLAQPEEVVAAMLLMLSPANTYMTGQSIAIDGGVTAI